MVVKDLTLLSLSKGEGGQILAFNLPSQFRAAASLTVPRFVFLDIANKKSISGVANT